MNQQEGHEKILIFKQQAKIKQDGEDTPFTTSNKIKNFSHCFTVHTLQWNFTAIVFSL
jgi:hypothetical protein